MKINYQCEPNLNPYQKEELDNLIPDAIQNGARLQLPETVDVEIVFKDPLNTTCDIIIHHPQKLIHIKDKFLV